MLKQFVIGSILFAFSFLLIPTNLWHDCQDQHVEHSKSKHSDAKFEKGSCFVCDFELFPIENQHDFQFFFESKEYPQFYFLALSEEQVAPSHAFLRGPPRI